MEMNYYVPNVHFEQIPIKNLVSNQDYQRNLSMAHIKRAAENFDPYQVNPIKVSRRDGINYVFNGQHTIEIVALASGSRETPVWCMIYDDLNYEHEADIFANQMKYVKQLNPCEIFNANIEAGNTKQLIIKNLVESYGLTIGKSQSGSISAVSTLESIYNKYGYHTLDHVLRLCIATWEGEQFSFSGKILNAVALVLVTYQNELNEDVFKEKLGVKSARALLRLARERGPGSICVAEAMVIEYNGKKKKEEYKLNIHKLYEKKPAYHPHDEYPADALEEIAPQENYAE